MTQPLYQTLSALDRAIITVILMSATLMQVIDTTIVNVALPHMQGSLGASSDEITWTLTCYLVSSAIFMPLTGFFADRFGRKSYLSISIAGFTIASALCGAATSLTQIVLFRVLQGFFGASLVPLSQAILTDIYPREERGKAMAIWGIGVMVGPILGPTLGGYLTEVSTWRWTFYVNIPVGIVTLFFINTIPDTPITKRSMDWLGFLFISLAIGGLQFVLDRGNSDDWFNSSTICLIAYLSLVGLIGFIFSQSRKNATPVFDLHIFQDRNFLISSILLCIFGLGFYGVMVLQPLLMEGLLHYPVLTTGLIMAPRGISGMISMMLISRIINHIDPRKIIISGILINSFGVYISTFYSINHISPFWIYTPLLIQGFGLGMIFVPLSTVAYSTLPVVMRTEAAGIYSLLRTIGGSVGISVIITIITRRSQTFWTELGSHITLYNPAVYAYLKPFHLKPTDPMGTQLLATTLHQQAEMLAFVNAFYFIMWSFLLMIPLVLLIRAKPGK